MAETETKPKVHRYVVVADAVVVTVGKKANGRANYTRVLRGGVINGAEGSESIASLLAKGSIVEVKSAAERDELQADLRDPARSRFRQTARKSAAAMGAPDDPVQPPQQSVLPVAAPIPPTSPDAITAE